MPSLSSTWREAVLAGSTCATHPRQAERPERVVDERLRGLGRVAPAPGAARERVPELDVRAGARERVQPGVADDRAAVALGHGEERVAAPGEHVAVRAERRRRLGERRVRAGADVAHDLRVGVDRVDLVVVGERERAQPQAPRRQLHSARRERRAARRRRPRCGRPSRGAAARRPAARVRRRGAPLDDGLAAAISHGASSACSSEPGNRLHRVSPHSVQRTASIDWTAPSRGVDPFFHAGGDARDRSSGRRPGGWRPAAAARGSSCTGGKRGREVLLVHPGGPFWAKKDAAPGRSRRASSTPGEDPRACALREFAEETGTTLPARRAREPGRRAAQERQDRGRLRGRGRPRRGGDRQQHVRARVAAALRPAAGVPGGRPGGLVRPRRRAREAQPGAGRVRRPARGAARPECPGWESNPHALADSRVKPTASDQFRHPGADRSYGSRRRGAARDGRRFRGEWLP